MSDPSYRIELLYDRATSTGYVWDWFVYDLNGSLQGSGSAETTEDATDQAQVCVRQAARPTPINEKVILFSDDRGNLTNPPEPQSLKAS